MIQHDLTGQWQMREMMMGTWMPVNIPGSVISALLENGKIDDPYYRTNEYEVREMMRKDYAFEKTFDVDEKILAMNDIELVCDGLDTIAEIYLNGQCIGKADNMHRTWRFDCRGILEAKISFRLFSAHRLNMWKITKKRKATKLQILQQAR